MSQSYWPAARHLDLRIVAADNVRRRGSELTLPRLRASNVTLAHCDVRQQEDLKSSRAWPSGGALGQGSPPAVQCAPPCGWSGS